MGDVHLHDPEFKTQEGYGKIRSSDLSNLTDMLKSALEQPETISEFMGCLLSQSRHQLDIVAPEPLWTAEEIAQHLESEGEIHRVSGLKALYHENESNTAYINGEVVKVEQADSPLLNVLCDDEVINSATNLSPSGVTVVTELVNKGYWFIED